MIRVCPMCRTPSVISHGWRSRQAHDAADGFSTTDEVTDGPSALVRTHPLCCTIMQRVFSSAARRTILRARRESDRRAGELKIDWTEPPPCTTTYGFSMPGLLEHYTPALPTVHKMAAYLKIPEKRLMALAGLLQVKDAQFQNESLKFAARSEPDENLTPEEHQAYKEYVKYLRER